MSVSYVDVELERVFKLQSAMIAEDNDCLFMFFKVSLQSADCIENFPANFTFGLYFAVLHVRKEVPHVCVRKPASGARILDRWADDQRRGFRFC